MATARKFTNASGVEWSIKVTVDVIERVREIGVDLGDVTAATLKRLSLDDVLLVRTLWLICEPQADALKVSPAQFGEDMLGQALDDAIEALRGSLEDFFPTRKREFFRRMVEMDRQAQERAMREGLAAMDDPETQAAMDQAMAGRIKSEIQNALTRLQSATASPG
jgi:hypothetical protein